MCSVRWSMQVRMAGRSNQKLQHEDPSRLRHCASTTGEWKSRSKSTYFEPFRVFEPGRWAKMMGSAIPSCRRRHRIAKPTSCQRTFAKPCVPKPPRAGLMNCFGKVPGTLDTSRREGDGAAGGGKSLPTRFSWLASSPASMPSFCGALHILFYFANAAMIFVADRRKEGLARRGRVGTTTVVLLHIAQ